MGFLKIAGDYTSWSVYRKSVIICDVTEMFINRALPRYTLAASISNAGMAEMPALANRILSKESATELFPPRCASSS